MSEEKVRKASDIILALEAKVESLTRQLSNIDNNIKLILNRLSNNNTKQPSIIPEPPVTEVVAAKKPLLPGLKPNVVLGPSGLQFQNETATTQQLTKSSKEKIEEKEDFDFTQVVSTPPVSGRKVAVQQRITYPDGKNICLANVELKSSNGEVIKKLRTNAMGKWIAVLEPGNYTVSIMKSANKNNQDVELTFPISVPESDRPIELPIPKVG